MPTLELQWRRYELVVTVFHQQSYSVSSPVSTEICWRVYHLGTEPATQANWASNSQLHAKWVLNHNHHHTITIYGAFPGPSGWAGARRKLLLDFMVLGRTARGRHTDNPGGRHSIQTKQQSTSINPPFLHRMTFLLQPSQFIMASDRHRNMLDCISPWLGWVLIKAWWYSAARK